MQKILAYLWKGFKYLMVLILKPGEWTLTYILFYLNGVTIGTFTTKGIPRVNVSIGGKMIFDENFIMNNRVSSNPIGRVNRCSYIVGPNAILTIGKNVGISSSAIVCHTNIKIEDNVNIGGNVAIYDTDFHSLNIDDRQYKNTDKKNAKTKPVVIGANAFIGAHCTILKGVTIGENAIVGACTVVTRDIPKNEIWAGNPARKIRSINQYNLSEE